MKSVETQGPDIEEDLHDLEINLNRLRVEYEQYFAGGRRREPSELRGRVQKIVTRLVNKPPRNSGHRFRFNQLNAKFQIYRQLWGRIMRQMDAGTYRPHRFKAKLQEQPAEATADTPKEQAAGKGAGIHELYSAFASARGKTGESLDLTPDKLALIVRKQTAALRQKHGKGTVRFRVVIENNRAKLKATMAKPK